MGCALIFAIAIAITIHPIEKNPIRVINLKWKCTLGVFLNLNNKDI